VFEALSSPSPETSSYFLRWSLKEKNKNSRKRKTKEENQAIRIKNPRLKS